MSLSIICFYQVAHLASLNTTTLVVHPSEFIVHRPHPKSKAMSLYHKV